jgi:hypothetical protein
MVLAHNVTLANDTIVMSVSPSFLEILIDTITGSGSRQTMQPEWPRKDSELSMRLQTISTWSVFLNSQKPHAKSNT